MSRAEELAKDWVLQVLQRNADNPDVVENARAAFVGGFRAAIEEAEKMKELTDIGGPDQVVIIEYVPLVYLRALLEPVEEGES